MNKIQIYAQHVGNGYYQVFIKNNSYSCDFIEIVQGKTYNHDKEKLFYLTDWKIISPLKPGDKVFIDEINPTNEKAKHYYFYDTKLRKPTRLIESFKANSPSAYKLPKTIGSEYILEMNERKSHLALRQYIDEIRVNLKDRYQFVRQIYIDITTNVVPQEKLIDIDNDQPTTRGLLDELLAISSFERDYNKGLQPKDMKDRIRAIYYSWFIYDWGLGEPTGEPPKELFEIEKKLKVAA